MSKIKNAIFVSIFFSSTALFSLGKKVWKQFFWRPRLASIFLPRVALHVSQGAPARETKPSRDKLLWGFVVATTACTHGTHLCYTTVGTPTPIESSKFVFLCMVAADAASPWFTLVK